MIRRDLDAPIVRPRALPAPLPLASIVSMIKAAARARDRRMVAALELLYGSGLRATELLGLTVHQLAKLPPTIIVKGKGGSERLVPLTPPALAAAGAWLRARAQAGITGPWVFQGRGAQPLTRQRLDSLLKATAVAAGVDATLVHAHAFRHAFATDMLDGGADLRVIQELLGHRCVTTTQVYTHVAIARTVRMVGAVHPLARTRRQAAK